MKWKATKYEMPTGTGVYIVSIHQQYPAGIVVSSDAAHYDAESFKWYKYDPFDVKYKPTEEITELVVGWIADMESYNG